MADTVMRALRHLFAGSARRLFPVDRLHRIALAIADGEATHLGQVCFAVESALPIGAVLAGHDPRRRAEEVFARLRVWDTEANNGVLLYLLLADHRIEIIADRGVAAKVDETQWRDVCARMEERLRAGEPEGAALSGVAAVSALLARHFPRREGDVRRNELPDLPQILD
jgi:uncharacterized membrane protein